MTVGDAPKPSLSAAQAAQQLGVSSATIRNWIKAGHLVAIATRPLAFEEDAVLHLKQQIGSASFTRLTRRANKSGTVQRLLPAEYADHPGLRAALQHILAALLPYPTLHSEGVMFLATLRLLEATDEVCCHSPTDRLKLTTGYTWARPAVQRIMMQWRDELKIDPATPALNSLYQSLLPYNHPDFLGLLYQSIVQTGHKSTQGSYYTPTALIADALAQWPEPVTHFLDPCCGAGKYLVQAAQRFQLAPTALMGFESDRIAANLARINLLLAFKNQNFLPQIFCVDALAELASRPPSAPCWDAIATNPPWGACKNAGSGESFAQFLTASIQGLCPGGRLSFILPESILNIKAHADIRKFIIQETCIATIAWLGRPFTGVFTPVIRLDLIRQPAPADWPVAITGDGDNRHIPQQRFAHNAYCMFDLNTTTQQKNLLHKLYAVPHVTLRHQAEWALGIVTGDNKKYVHDHPKTGAEAVWRGSDLAPYCLRTAQSFIHFIPSGFQQVAPERLYRAPEKLIYKFISKKLAFVYDNQQRLTLNSANLLIPALAGISIKVVLAFLNSKVFQYIYQQQFATHKVLRSDLETLPFPLLSLETQQQIEHLVDLALAQGATSTALETTIFSAFGLSADEIHIITYA